MKKLLLLSIVCLMIGCKANDPEAILLMGRWEFVEYTTSFDNMVYKADPLRPAYTTFGGNGRVGDVPESYPFEGGWCNFTKEYIYANKELRFTFTEPNCIPFVPQFGNEKATVLELSESKLMVAWKGLIIKYKRPQ